MERRGVVPTRLFVFSEPQNIHIFLCVKKLSHFFKTFFPPLLESKSYFEWRVDKTHLEVTVPPPHKSFHPYLSFRFKKWKINEWKTLRDVFGARKICSTPPQRNERKYDGIDALPERALNV